jgi:hypothetical protein
MITSTRQPVTADQFERLSTLGLPIPEDLFCRAWDVQIELLDFWLRFDWTLYDPDAVLNGAAAAGKYPHIIYNCDDAGRIYVRVAVPSHQLLWRRFEIQELKRIWELSPTGH